MPAARTRRYVRRKSKLMTRPSSPRRARPQRYSGIYLGCLCGNFGQEVAGQRSRNHGQRRVLVDAGRLAQSGRGRSAASSVASTSAGMPANPRRPARNSADRDLVGGIEHGRRRRRPSPAPRAPAPAPETAPDRAPRRSGSPTCARSSRARRPVDALRPGQAMGDRDAHVGRARAARSPSRRGTRPGRARSTADAPARRSASDGSANR